VLHGRNHTHTRSSGANEGHEIPGPRDTVFNPASFQRYPWRAALSMTVPLQITPALQRWLEERKAEDKKDRTSQQLDGLVRIRD
jgi:hypothetical protein